MTRAIGYIRVSTEEQALSGLGLAAQRAVLEQEADRRGWDLEVIEDAGFSGKNLNRPGITAALQQLAAGDAEILVIAKLDRVSRSVSDFAGLAELARKQGWKMNALDIGMDMTTPMGELFANFLASMAQWERAVIGERTRTALQAKKAAGARLGAPVVLPAPVRTRICELRNAHTSLRAIADRLNADGVPTAKGGARWHASTVRAVLRSIDLDAEAARARDLQDATRSTNRVST